MKNKYMKKTGSPAPWSEAFYGVYPVITEKFCLNGSGIKTLREVLKGGAKIVQMREKDYPCKKIYEMALVFRKLTREAGALLIINDWLDIALAVDADGVHLGQDDLPVAAARKAAPDMIIGVSTHNIKEALKAKNSGATYVNVGPIFSTKTKETQCRPLGPDAIPIFSKKIKIPFTVMGGIKSGNIRDVLERGARCIAVVTEITMSANPAKTVKKLNEIIAKYENRQ
jgi:thiamine-phosphate pyrophosphorylase